MAPVVGYWCVHGIAQPIRFMLAYTETPFVDKQYSPGPPPDYNLDAWMKEKYKLGLEFPNLPYYIDGDIKITQSLAIIHYLARKHKLEPETEEDRIRADMIEQQIVDIRKSLENICYSSEFDKLKDEFVKSLPGVLKPISKFLGKRNWFASQDKLTYVDFMVYDILENHKTLAPDCLDDYQNLQDFARRFEELPTIKKYMKSDDYLKTPFNGIMANFGTKPKK